MSEGTKLAVCFGGIAAGVAALCCMPMDVVTQVTEFVNGWIESLGEFGKSVLNFLKVCCVLSVPCLILCGIRDWFLSPITRRMDRERR